MFIGEQSTVAFALGRFMQLCDDDDDGALCFSFTGVYKETMFLQATGIGNIVIIKLLVSRYVVLYLLYSVFCFNMSLINVK